MLSRDYEINAEQTLHNYIWSLKEEDDETIDKWIRQYKNGNHDPELKQQIFGQYARYVMRMAHHYSNSLKTPVYGVTDVFNEGYIAFERALETFDPDAGFKFLTYAAHWICRYMHRFTTMNAWECYFPAGLSADLKRAIAIRFKIINAGGVYSPQSLIDELGVTPRVAETLYKLSLGKSKSLNVSVPELDNDAEVIDIIPDDSVDIITEVIKDDRLENLLSLIDKVSKTDRDKTIILMRYGLPPYNRTYTLAEIGDGMGVSRERIRQLEKKTLKKMRDILESKKEDYICE